ncbi:RYamide receptor-like [Dreissena polymorpha]|uniref:RYamide receptor-like n=1 Tax=Dreissena polymorpha TaxID=45954 RepID=UPI0022644C91|nr:RYamide receptor-like [Dreissena polymorpha]
MDFTFNTSTGLELDRCDTVFNTIQIFWLVSYSVLFIISVGGNCLVCLVVIGQERMRTVTNYFLLNLAIGDIAKGVLCIPFTFVINVLVPYWPFGSFMCPFIMYMQIVTVFLSAFTLVAMSFDRYVAIIHPLRPKLTTRKALLTIAIVWILALAVPIPTVVKSRVYTNPYPNTSKECQKGLCLDIFEDNVLQQVYTIAIMCIQYVIPLIVLMFTYTRIGYIIWIKRTPGEAERRRDERIASSKRKMVKMMIVMVITYAVCWLPIHAIRLYEENIEDSEALYNSEHYQFTWTGFHWLAMSYACYNPIVYFWMNKRFRAGFKSMFFLCTHCKKGNGRSICSKRRPRLPNRTNSGSSSRFSPRASIDETKILKMSFLHKDHGDPHDL